MKAEVLKSTAAVATQAIAVIEISDDELDLPVADAVGWCTQGHALAKVVVSRPVTATSCKIHWYNILCDQCGTEVPDGSATYQCKTCNFDCCLDCLGSSRAGQVKVKRQRV